MKRLLPTTPQITSPQTSRKKSSAFLFDTTIDNNLELIEQRLQNQITLGETLLCKGKDKDVHCANDNQYAKRSQSPSVNSRYGGVTFSTIQSSTSSSKQFKELKQQLLRNCSNRLNFQQGQQKGHMGQENSRLVTKSRRSFTSSHCLSTVTLAKTRTHSVALDDSTRETQSDTAKRLHANSTGSLQTDTDVQVARQKRLMNDLCSSSKSSRSSNLFTSAAKTGAGKLLIDRTSKKSGISTASQSIINFCVDNAKGDIASRVINRMMNKREDFNMFIGNLSLKQQTEFTNSLRDYFVSIVQNLQSTEKICEISASYGTEQVSRRAWGFKADYFAVMADALTTECVFLDGAQHQPTEAIEAWAELVNIMFTNIRNGYYQMVRNLRKSSQFFHSTMFSRSSELSTEDTPPTSIMKPAET